jgi:hypothetical protein
MVTIDLNVEPQWAQLLQKVEQQGEVVRIMRGDKEVALIAPTSVLEEERELAEWAALGLRQLAEAFPPNEFADWEQGNGTR